MEINSFSFGITNSGLSGKFAGGTAKESGSVANIDVTRDAVTATSAGLFLNFSATGPSLLKFLDADDAFLLCSFTDEACDPPGSGQVLQLGAGPRI